MEDENYLLLVEPDLERIHYAKVARAEKIRQIEANVDKTDMRKLRIDIHRPRLGTQTNTVNTTQQTYTSFVIETYQPFTHHRVPALKK